MAASTLKPTRWLAERLGISITTIERLRSAGSPEVPPSIRFGSAIRYDEAMVEQWLRDRAKPKTEAGAQHVAP